MSVDHKTNPRLWAVVTVIVAVIGCFGTVLAAIIPRLINPPHEPTFSSPTNQTIVLPTNTVETPLLSPFTPEPTTVTPIISSSEVPPTSALVGCQTTEINVSVNSDNFSGNVIITLEKIDVCGSNMKWYISFWNKTSDNAGLAFAEDRSYVVDEFGTRYNILSSSPSNFIDSSVQAGIRLSGWLEFDTPENNAKEFSLYLVQWSFGSTQVKRQEPITFSLTSPLAPK